MATEELKIRITAEAQDAINKVKAVKDNLQDINKNTGVSKMTSDFEDGAIAAGELADKLSGIRGMNFGDLVTSFATMRATMKANKIAAAKLAAEMTYYEDCVENVRQELRGLAKDYQFYEQALSGNLLGDGSAIFDKETLESDFEEVKARIKELQGVYANDTAKLKGLQDAAANSSTKMFANMTTKAKIFGAALGAVVATLAVFTAACKTALNVSQSIRMDFFDARKVGLSTASYQEWAYVLGQVGVEADALSDFIKSLSAAQNDLRDGSEAMTQAFKDLGFNIDEVVNMGQEELFTETIKRLQQLENQVQKTSIAYRIFGEDDASKVANLMSLNNQEMERMIRNFYLLGGAASDSAIEKSLTLQNAVSSMKLAWQGLANTIGEAVMPALTAIVRGLTKVIAFVNMFLRAVFGFDIVSSSSKSVNKATASVGGYSNAVKGATAAAKELKRTTMGFDELNIVSDPNKDAGGGGGASDFGDVGGGGGSFEMPELGGLTEDLGLDKMAAWIEKYKTQIQTLTPIIMVAIGLVGGIACLATGHWIAAIPLLAMAGIGIAIGFSNGTWKKLFGGIVDAAKNAGKKFKKFLDDVKTKWNKFWSDVGKKCKEGLANIKKWFDESWDKLKTGWNNFWDGIKKGWDKFWTDTKQKVSNGLAAVKKFFDESWQKLKTGWNNFWDNIKKGWDNFWTTTKQKVRDGLEAIKKFFSDAWNSIKTTATTAWNNIKTTLETTWNNIKTSATNIWNAIKKFFSDTWEAIKTNTVNTWNNIKTTLSDTWESIKTTATTAWNNFKKMIVDTWEDIKKKADELCANLKKFFEDAWKKIKETWDVVKQYFKDIWDNIKSAANTLCDNLKSFFSNAWSNIKSTWDAVKGYFSGIWDSIKSTASSMLESVKGFFSGAWTSIKNTWSVVTGWFGDIWTGIKGKFSGVSTWFGDTFGSAVTAIKNKWSDIKEWFQEKWNSVKNVFTSAGTSIGSSITTALKNSFNNFMSSAVGKINSFIRSINSAIGLINKIPGVNIGTLRELPVPQLAKGGIVTGNILANIGERGKEAVLPLENNTGWMDALADRIAARNGGSTRVVLQIDGRELGWATIEQINAITKQTGGLQLVL